MSLTRDPMTGGRRDLAKLPEAELRGAIRLGERAKVEGGLLESEVMEAMDELLRRGLPITERTA
jgi:hypothetical protein